MHVQWSPAPYEWALISRRFERVTFHEIASGSLACHMYYPEAVWEHGKHAGHLMGYSTLHSSFKSALSRHACRLILQPRRMSRMEATTMKGVYTFLIAGHALISRLISVSLACV